MNYLIFFLLFITVNCSVSKPSVQTLIAEKIERICSARVGCEIEMPDTISFPWDKLYVFQPGILDVEIEGMIGKKVVFSEEFSNKYVFLLDNKVVYTEEHHINFDRFADGTVMFGANDEARKFASIDRSSRFEVRIDRRGSRTTFYLTCANCEP